MSLREQRFKSGTFQNLFPTNHLFYGYMDFSSLQNLHDIRLAYTVKPTTTSRIALEGHTHFLSRTTDFWYNVAARMADGHPLAGARSHGVANRSTSGFSHSRLLASIRG